MRIAGFALLTAGVVFVSGFVVQWIGLPRAGRGDAAAARATVWLDRYRETRGEIVLHGRQLHATCVRGWIDDWRGRDRRGTELTLGDGSTIRDIPPHTLILGGPRARRPVALLQAAGCTRVLGDQLAALSEFQGGARAVATRVDGMSALAVHFPTLTVYVDRRSGRPIGARNAWASGMFRLVASARRAS